MRFPPATQDAPEARIQNPHAPRAAARPRGPIPPGWLPRGWGSHGDDDDDGPDGGDAGFGDGPPGSDDDADDAPSPRREPRYRNTIGSIVTWAIIRAAIVITAAWLLYEYMDLNNYGLWWMATAMAIYAIVIHPITIQYRIYREEARAVIDGTLCSSCRSFEETSVLCMKLDQHVSSDVIPCEGLLWEPRSRGREEDMDED